MIKKKSPNSELLRIQSILEKKDVKAIKQVGKYRGFIDKVHRIQAYQLIMGMSNSKLGQRLSEHCSETKFRKFEDVIMHDISRSFHHLSISKEYNTKQRTVKREEFKGFIYAQLGAHPEIQYYQGMNDIAELMFTYYGKSYGYIFLEYFQLNFFDGFTGNEFDVYLHVLTDTIIEILSISRPKIADTLDNHEKIGFLWPWLLTNFIHSLSNIEIINRILDFVLCSSKFDITFICVAVVQELWDICLDRYYPNISFDLLTEVYYHKNLDFLNWDNIMLSAVKLSDTEEIIRLVSPDVLQDKIDMKEEIKAEEERLNHLKHSPYSKLVESPGKNTWYENFLGNFWTEHNSMIDVNNKSFDNNNYKNNNDVENGMITPEKNIASKEETKYKGFVTSQFGSFKLYSTFNTNPFYSQRHGSDNEKNPKSNKMIDDFGSPISHKSSPITQKSSTLTQKELSSTTVGKRNNSVDE